MSTEEQQGAATMEDTILATLRGIGEREDEAGEGAAATSGQAAEGAAAGADSAAAGQKARDTAGRFAARGEQAAPAPKPGAEAGAAEAPAGAEGAPAADAGVEVPVRADGKPVDLNRPPSEWKPAAKAEWAALSPSVRAEVLRRETDAFKKVQEVLPEANLGRSIRQALAPFQASVQMDGGGDVVRAVAGLAQTAHTLRFGTPPEKQAAMANIARAYGIPWAAGQPGGQQQDAAGAQAGQQQPIYDPRVDTILRNLQAEERRRAAEVESQSVAATQNFIGATDEKGQPRYPFVDNVMDDMVARVQQLRAQSPSLTHGQVLEKAYEAAVWANPETRAILIQQQQQAQSAQTREANLRKVADAKRAAAGNLPRRGTAPGAEPVGKMEDTILETYRSLTAG